MLKSDSATSTWCVPDALSERVTSSRDVPSLGAITGNLSCFFVFSFLFHLEPPLSSLILQHIASPVHAASHSPSCFLF